MFSKQFISTLCLVGAAIIWGTAFVAQTTGMEYVGPLTFTNVRFIIGGLLVLPFAIKEFPKLQKVTEKKKANIDNFSNWFLFSAWLLFTTVCTSIYQNR